MQLLWVKRKAHLYDGLSINITREVCLFLPFPLPCVSVTSTSIRQLDFAILKLGSATPLKRSIRILNGRWLTVDSTRTFLCEGGSNGSD